MLNDIGLVANWWHKGQRYSETLFFNFYPLRDCARISQEQWLSSQLFSHQVKLEGQVRQRLSEQGGWDDVEVEYEVCYGQAVHKTKMVYHRRIKCEGEFFGGLEAAKALLAKTGA